MSASVSRCSVLLHAGVEMRHRHCRVLCCCHRGDQVLELAKTWVVLDVRLVSFKLHARARATPFTDRSADRTGSTQSCQVMPEIASVTFAT
jgi:hypothetical protein